MNKNKYKIVITEEQKEELTKVANSQTAQSRDALRAKVILLSAENKTYKQIQEKTDFTDRTISKWRKRFIEHGIDGLKDIQRPGRTKKIDYLTEAFIVQIACSKPDEGCTKWSQRRIAKRVKCSQSTVCRTLKKK